jgi:hypothetical protein
MSSWVNRTVLSGSSVNANGTTSHTCTFTAAAAGNFLVAIIAGSVTSSTPTGWTLQVSAINNTGLYVFTKTAGSGESSFSTTHNSSDYAIKGIVYEFAAGTTFLNGNQAVGLAQASTITSPGVTGLSGTYTRFSARAQGMTNANSDCTVSWTTPTGQDYDSYIVKATNDGVFLGIGTDDNASGSSFTPSYFITTNNSSGTGEGISFALNVVSPPSTTPFVWLGGINSP